MLARRSVSVPWGPGPPNPRLGPTSAYTQLNFNEAVNFALPDWLPEGKESVVGYKRHFKAPVFSHNELLITITLYSDTIKTALW